MEDNHVDFHFHQHHLCFRFRRLPDHLLLSHCWGDHISLVVRVKTFVYPTFFFLQFC